MENGKVKSSWLLAINSWLLTFGYSFLALDSWLLAFGYSFLALGFWLLILCF
jgi:hypothetical protein